MEKNKILYVTQEINPFLIQSEISNLVRTLAQGVYETDKEIRIFMPRFGVINERRHQLHEVIRLSGMNLIVNDYDHPLIIKVASIPQIRIQVYFIDNEEFFPKKQMFHDLEGKFMSNNDERMIFYCKGVIETVRKLGWKPDIIHCQGWFTSLVPMYIKKLYSEDPLFEDVKVIYSVFDNSFKGSLGNSLPEKLLFEDLNYDDVKDLSKANSINLNKYAVFYSDAVIQATKKIDKRILDYIKLQDKPFMSYPGSENYLEAYQNFYSQFINEPELIES